MTKCELEQEYFEWMYEVVIYDKPRKKPNYTKLLSHLNTIQFNYIIGLDENRASDGEELRYIFGHECGYSDTLIANYLDDRPCSVLEMIVALARRCEEHIMFNPDLGNRTGKWFWDMMASLGIDDMYDSRFSVRIVNEKINQFMNRAYERNGEGGLFTIDTKKMYDLRTIDIWYQAMWYLDEQLNAG